MKAFHGIRPTDDLQLHAKMSPQTPHPVDQLPSVAAVCPDSTNAQPGVSQRLQDEARPVAVLDVGGVHTPFENQGECIDEEVSFAPVDRLAGIVPFRPPRSVVLTDWLSRIAALGYPDRPSLRRTSKRSLSCTRFQVPSRVHSAKYLKTEFHGGKSCGSDRHGQP